MYTPREVPELSHIERRAGLVFERATCPQPKDLAKAACKVIIGLFCEDIGLFCEDIGFFCKDLKI